MRVKQTAIKVLFFSSLLVLGMPSVAMAQVVPTVPNPSKFNTLEEIINTVGGLVRPAVIIALIAILMYGGFVWLTAAGNDDKVALSKKIITGALVGFGLVVLAPVIVDFAGSLLGVRGGLTDLVEVSN